MKNKKIKSKGQTALEYALVVGVICVGVIFAGKKLFGGENSEAGKLMSTSIKSASGTIDKDSE